jgi:fatty-acyl-CoA synthase
MATLTVLNVDIKKLGEQLKADLPAYAKPMFIRLTSGIEHTGMFLRVFFYYCIIFKFQIFTANLGSFKPQKMKLVEEGYDIDIISDKVYYFDVREKNYNELTREIHKEILSGNMRF